MLNSIIIMGRITKDLELRQTNSGIPVLSFTVAVERKEKGADGNRPVDFIDCVAWRATAETISRYFGKGRLIAVQGSLYIENWTDKSGNSRKNAKVTVNNFYFCGEKKDTRREQSARDAELKKNPYDSYGGFPDFDGQVPFEDFGDFGEDAPF